MYKSFLLSLLLVCVFLSAPSAASGSHDYSFKDQEAMRFTNSSLVQAYRENSYQN